MVSIISFGAYIPRKRLQRQAAVEANSWFNPSLKAYSSGERAMCNWDEDSVTMAVEALRDCIGDKSTEDLTGLIFATTSAPFKDRQHAGILTTALNLGDELMTMDVTAAQRAGTTGFVNALKLVANGGKILFAAADKRRTKAASPQELLYGDGAAAFLIGNSDGAAEFIAAKQLSVDFIDHYKGDGEEFDYHWEERWIRDEGYMKLIPKTLERLFEETKTDPSKVDHFIMPCVIRRVGTMVAKAAGILEENVCDNMHHEMGESGTAHALILLARILESAKPGELIVVAGFGQGCDILMFKASEKVEEHRPKMGVTGFLARRSEETNYNKYLAFNNLMTIDHGLRSEVDKQTALTALYRNKEMLTGFIGGKCQKCGTLQFPKSKVCVNPNCGEFHSQEDHPFADMPAQVQSWTADNLTYAVEPPQHFGMVVFEEGGRLMSDLTDVDIGGVEVGMPMRMMFRVKEFDGQRGFTRYFWKAAPDFTKING